MKSIGQNGNLPWIEVKINKSETTTILPPICETPPVQTLHLVPQNRQDIVVLLLPTSSTSNGLRFNCTTALLGTSRIDPYSTIRDPKRPFFSPKYRYGAIKKIVRLQLHIDFDFRAPLGGNLLVLVMVSGQSVHLILMVWRYKIEWSSIPEGTEDAPTVTTHHHHRISSP